MGMHLLPGEITTDILSRLPVDSVIRCKLVCKTWQSFIIDPVFVALHARRFISDQENHTYGFLLWINLKPFKYSFGHIRFGEYNDNDNDNEKKISSFKLSKPTSWYPYQKRGINWIAMNSCNGLILMTTFHSNEMAICNPCTREFVNIPPLLNITGKKLYNMIPGFGINPSTNEYKIVALCNKIESRLWRQSRPQLGKVSVWRQSRPQLGKVSVYTLGSGKWRDKRFSQEFGASPSLHLNGASPSLHLNGAVYWVNQYTREIVSFDLETEEFRIVPSPSLPPGRPGMHYDQLGSLGGCLYVIRKQHYKAVADVLVRNKEDHTWSWKFSITYEELGSSCKPLAILRSGKILWYSAHRKPYVGSYDPETGILEMDDNLSHQFTGFIHIIHYEKCFVSLKALGEMNARICDLEE